MGQVQVAVDKRTVDKQLLFNIAIGNAICSIITMLVAMLRIRVQRPLQARIRRHYVSHIFHARARLDLPTFDDPAVQRQLDSVSNLGSTTVAWQTVQMVTGLGGVAINVISQVAVLATVLRGQPDGPLLAILSIIPVIAQKFQFTRLDFRGNGGMSQRLPPFQMTKTDFLL
jgi:ABC-type multidrug transport system fused ATPase/permease subunit